jgi:hypothetical protein
LERHLKAALREIDRHRPVPLTRRSTRWCFVAENERHYPPKYVLSRAVYHKTGEQLGPFKAGATTRSRLDEATKRKAVKKCNRLPDCQDHITFSN